MCHIVRLIFVVFSVSRAHNFLFYSIFFFHYFFLFDFFRFYFIVAIIIDICCCGDDCGCCYNWFNPRLDFGLCIHNLFVSQLPNKCYTYFHFDFSRQSNVISIDQLGSRIYIPLCFIFSFFLLLFVALLLYYICSVSDIFCCCSCFFFFFIISLCHCYCPRSLFFHYLFLSCQ